MSKYNLIRNGIIQSLTTSGTGNVELSWTELEYLMDETTQTTPGANSVTVSGSDVLYLEVDLSSRIKVDGIRLYMTSATASGTILSDYLEFYYKNETSDSYSTCSKSLGSGYYSATITSPSAPRYVVCVVSGIAASIYEFEVFNDDYIVAFGTDGQTYAEYLEDTPVGEIGNPQAIAIYNNSTGTFNADAYTCVDWTGVDADEYVEISSEEDGTYYALSDGVILQSDNTDEEYRWSNGSHNGTTVSNDKVVPLAQHPSRKLGQIPLATKTDSFKVAENAMTYDPINKKMYVMGSDGILKLWEYHMDTDTYTYITEIWPGGTSNHAYMATMIYLNGYIYAMKDDGGGWGRHDLSGAIGNWQTLTSHPNGHVKNTGASDITGKRALCTDGVRYIYCIDQATTYTELQERFARFDTVGLTWSSMNAGYYTYYGNFYSWSHLFYGTDGVKDYIYYMGNMGTLPDNTYWVQRYDVSANSWIQQYYNTETFRTKSNESRIMLYCNKQLWFKFSGEATTLYRYDIPSDTLTNFTADFDIYDAAAPDQQLKSIYGIAIPDETNNDLGVKLYFGGTQADLTSMYVWPDTTGNVYTTPIFKLDNQYNASYFIIDGTAVSGTGSISYDPDVYNGSIRVRSSDTEPIPLVEAWYMYFSGDRYAYALKYTPYTGSTSGSMLLLDLGGDTYRRRQYTIAGTAVSMTKERIAHSFSDRSWDSANYSSYIYITNRSGTVLYSNSYGPVAGGTDVNYKYYFSTNMEFDKWGGIWGYGSTMPYLLHFNYSVGTILASIYDGSNFLYDLSVEYEGDNVWYTNTNTNQIIRLNSAGTTQVTINQRQPRALCANQDGTIWVNDTADSVLKKFNYDGTQALEIDLDIDFTRMRSDFNNGFWAYNSSVDNVYHYNSSGVQTLDVHFDRIDGIAPSHEGCAVFDTVTNIYYFIDFSGSTYRSRTVEGEVVNCAMFSSTYDNDKTWGLTSVPATHDPVWKSAGTAEWQEVRKDGYFLPKVRYHQVEVTLREDSELNKIIMAPAVKIQDIAPGTSKNMYIRTNIPEGADITDYETKLRTWWGEVD